MTEPYGHQRGIDIVGQLRWCLNRIYHTVRWSKIKKVPDESGVVSKIQIETFKDQEINDDVLHVQHYGFHSVPDILCDVITLNLAGNNHHPTIIASNDQRYKPKDRRTGESLLHDNKNQVVYLREGQKVVIMCNDTMTINCKKLIINAETEMVVNSPKTIFSGDVQIQGNLEVLKNVNVGGNVAADGDVVSGGIEGVSLNTHIHIDIDGDGLGFTEQPMREGSSVSNGQIINTPFQAGVTDTAGGLPTGDKYD